MLQIATAFLLQSATRFITNCDRYYKVRWLLQIATVQHLSGEAENSSTLYKFHEGRKGPRPMGSNADLVLQSWNRCCPLLPLVKLDSVICGRFRAYPGLLDHSFRWRIQENDEDWWLKQISFSQYQCEYWLNLILTCLEFHEPTILNYSTSRLIIHKFQNSVFLLDLIAIGLKFIQKRI